MVRELSNAGLWFCARLSLSRSLVWFDLIAGDHGSGTVTPLFDSGLGFVLQMPGPLRVGIESNPALSLASALSDSRFVVDVDLT